jgi:WD40 repeat protein
VWNKAEQELKWLLHPSENDTYGLERRAKCRSIRVSVHFRSACCIVIDLENLETIPKPFSLPQAVSARISACGLDPSYFVIVGLEKAATPPERSQPVATSLEAQMFGGAAGLSQAEMREQKIGPFSESETLMGATLTRMVVPSAYPHIASMDFTPMDRLLVAAGKGEGPLVIDVARGKPAGHLLDSENADLGEIRQVSISSDGKWTAAAVTGVCILIWDMDRVNTVEFRAEYAVAGVKFVPGTHTLIGLSNNGAIGVWERSGAPPTWERVVHEMGPVCTSAGQLNVSRTGRIAYGYDATHVNTLNWDRVTLSPAGHPENPFETAGFRLLALSASGRYLALVRPASSGQFVLRDMNSGETHDCGTGDAGETIESAAFVPQGSHIFAACQSGRLLLFSIPALALVGELLHPGTPESLAVSSSGKCIAVSLTDGCVHLWKI